jgi:hypothetical protein
VQRHDNEIRGGGGGGNEGEELRCRNCTHIANFLSSGSFEQGKKVPKEQRLPSRRAPMDG